MNRRLVVAIVASMIGLVAGVGVAWALTRSPDVRVVQSPGRTITKVRAFHPTGTVQDVSSGVPQSNADLPAIAVPVMATIASTPPPTGGGGGQASPPPTSSAKTTSTSLCGGALC